MCKFIGIEDLAANALIERTENAKSGQVSFKELIDYGNAIIQFYSKEYSGDAVLMISRDCTEAVIRNYSDFFAVTDDGEQKYFALKEGKTVADLRENFRAFLSIEMLISFTSKESLDALGVTRLGRKAA